MTTEEFWGSWLAIFFLAGPILIGFSDTAYSLYLSRRHLDPIKEALKNSHYIYLWGPSLGKRGLMWSLLEISKIAGMILMPKASLRIGELDPGDLENFPPYLKRLLKTNFSIMIAGAVWLLAVAVLLEFR